MRRYAAVLSVAALLLSGCTGSPADETDDAQPSSSAPQARGGEDLSRYVALGDSFTSGPLVPITNIAEGCFRSDGNYPSLLAAELDLDLTDVSCSGARTRHLVRRQPTLRETSIRPQLDAVDRRTDLVTVGIGGNDFGLFSNVVRTCVSLRAEDPTGSPCADSGAASGVLTDAARIGDHVARALTRIRARAPAARVVVVGYLRIAPSEGQCPRVLPLAAGDVAFGDRVLRALNDALQRAARSAGVDYFDAYRASAGHDVCSDEPWVNGPNTQPGVAAAFHPLAAGMRGVADGLEELLAGE